MVRALSILAAGLLIFGCGGVVTTDVELAPGSWAGTGALPPEHLEFVVVPGEDAPTVQNVTHDGAVISLAHVQGRMVVGNGNGLWMTVGDDSLELGPVDVRIDVREATTVSGVSVVGQRQSGELLIATPEGVFHSYEGSFFHSPLSEVVDTDTVRSLHAAGLDAAEHVWIARDDATEVHGSNTRWRLRIEGLPPAGFAAGLISNQGFLSVGEDLWMVQTDPGRATLRLSGIGPVTQARWSGGTLNMAARDALLEASPSGALNVTRFVNAHGATLQVRAVDHGPGGVHVLAGDHVLRRDGTGFRHLAEVPGALPHMAVDSWGQIWVATAGGLRRVRSGEAVTFAQVEPFLVENCLRCHADGSEGAPRINFLDYETASAWAFRILARVSDSQSPMPPRRVDVLAPEDWALVKRWVEGGALP